MKHSPRNAASAEEGLAGLRPWHQDPRVIAARQAVANGGVKAEAVATEAKAALRALEEAEARAEHAAAEGRDVDADALSIARRRYEDARALEQIHRGAVRPAADRLAATEQEVKGELTARIDAAFQEKLQELDTAMMRVLALHRELSAITEREVLLGQGGHRLFLWAPLGAPGRPSGYLSWRVAQQRAGFTLPEVADETLPAPASPPAADMAGHSNRPPERIVVRMGSGGGVLLDDNRSQRTASKSVIPTGVLAVLGTLAGLFR